jgi:hypothetical protein
MIAFFNPVYIHTALVFSDHIVCKMSQSANIEIVNSSFTPFNNAADYDLAVFTTTVDQSIHFGASNGAQSSMMKVTKSNVEIRGNVDFTGALTKNGVAFQSGTPGLSNNGTNLYVISGSNFGVGTSAPSNLLHVAQLA